MTIFTWPATGDGRNEGHLSLGNKFINCNFKKKGIVVANYGLETEFIDSTFEMTAHTDETSNTYNVAVAHVGTLSHDVYGADRLKMIGCTIKMRATSAGGRGVHLNQADNCVLTNNTVINNGVAGKGTGIDNDGTGNSITGTTCTGVATCVG
jgi:parallel beta-helix repeat protein